MADRDELLEHNYDGIQEYDNDLPRWWLGIFVVTAIFALGYLFYMHSGSFESQHDRLARELSELKEFRAKLAAQRGTAGMGAEQLLALTKDAEVLGKGQQIFAQKCVVCHAPAGQGLIGPNLTDDFWIHGGSIGEIQKVVLDGVLDKGMLAWRGQLKDDEINAVVAYVWTLHGSNPPNPKEAQGVKVERK